MDCRNEAPKAFERYRASGAGRVDACPEKRFANVDIAESGDDPLVEQKELDGCSSTGEPPLKLLRRDLERLGPKRFEGGPFGKLIGSDEVERAEPPGIVKSEPPPIVRFDKEVVMLLNCCLIDSPPARHTEVEYERIAAIGVD